MTLSHVPLKIACFAVAFLSAVSGIAQTPITLSVNITHVICKNANTGAIDLSVTGGVPPYNYDWSNLSGPSNPEDLAMLNDGYYCVTVTDVAGKTATGCYFVNEPHCPVFAKKLPLLVVVNGQPVTIAPQVMNGTSPYTYKWSNNTFNAQTVVSPASNSTYTVTVTDAKGCTGSSSYTVEVVGSSPTILFDFYNPGCVNGFRSAVVHTYNLPPGPYTYTLVPSSPFQPVITGTFSGNTFNLDNICTYGCQYTLTISNAGGNLVSKSFGNPGGLIGVIVTTPLKITSDNPSLCPPSVGTQCERVCPNTTVTYHVEPYFASCDGSTLSNYDWVITGAQSYYFNAGKDEATITWGAAGGGNIKITNNNGACYSSAYCVEIVELPEAKIQATPGPVAPDSILTICRGQEVNCTSTSLNASALEWHFSDDASIKTGEKSTHVFQQAGVFSVTLIARSACYCADTAFLTVKVLDLQAPSLDCVSAVCPGESVTYSTSTDCGELSWEVSPNGIITGGGGIADDSITVQWLDGANGYISLEATNCASAECPVKSIIPVPVIAAHAEIKGPNVVCPSSEEYYSIDAFDGASYKWEIIPNTSSAPTIVSGQGTAKILVRFNQYTTKYSIIVHYDNCYLGCSGSDTLEVLIRTVSTISGPARVCAGQPATFSVNYSIYKFNWSVLDRDGMVLETFSDQYSISPQFSQGPGDYLLVAVPNAATQLLTCTRLLEWKVSVSAVPSKPLSIDGPSCYCPGSVQLYTATGNSGQLSWKNSLTGQQDFGNPYNLPIPANTNGAIWVSVKSVANDGSGCSSDTILKWIQPLETPKINGSANFCVGAVGSYASNPSIAGLSYSWEIVPTEAGVIVQGQASANIQVFWLQPGNHTLKVNICGKTASMLVAVNPAAVPTVLHPAGICVGELASVSAPGSWSAYRWETEDQIFISSNPSVSIGPGTYLLRTVNSLGCEAARSFEILEYPKPNISISTISPTGFCNNALNVAMYALTDDDANYQYEWFRDGLPLGHNQSSLSSNQYGLYSAQASNEFGCMATDGFIRVFEYCGPGIIFDEDHPNYCPAGSLGIDVLPSAQCDSFQFEVLASPNYMPGSAVWTFGQSGDAVIGGAAGENVGFRFPNAGKYLVILVATLQNGATCALIDSVDVDAIARFTVNKACPGDQTAFTDESTRLPYTTIDSWHWSFGDPAGATIDMPVNAPVKHPYNAPGSYTATLTITAGSGCTSTYSEALEVPALPQLALAPTVNGCVDQVVQLSAQTTADVLFLDWEFGQAGSPGNTASGMPVYHYYGNAPGVYSAVATATNIWGCRASVAQMVVISNDQLSGEISPSGVSNICAGQSVTLTAPPGAAAYLWSNGATTANIEAEYEGLYQVSATSPGGCKYNPLVKVVNILPTPNGFIQAQLLNSYGQNIGTVTSILNVCAGDDVHLLVQAAGNYQYAWSNGVDTTQTLSFTNKRNNQLAVGQHEFQVTITDIASGCTMVTPPFTVNVRPRPDGFSAASSSACSGEPAAVYYVGPSNPNWQLVWNNGMIGESFTTTAPGRFIVQVTNEFGCSASSEPVVLSPGPNVGGIPKGCHQRCAPDSICLPAIPGVAAWQWYFNGQPIPGAESADFIAQESGTYFAQLTDSIGCTATSDPLTLQLFTGDGSVFSNVWADVNQNGLLDATDTLLTGIPILLFQNQSQVATGQSATNGAAVFPNIPSAAYSVLIDSANLNPFWEIIIGAEQVLLHGCGGKAYANLLLGHCITSPVGITFNTCPGAPISYLGTTIAAGQSQQFILPNIAGCDTLVIVTVNALPTSASTLTLSACPGSTYTYAGVDLAVGQTQDFTLTNALGCDSIVTVTVNALPTSASTLTLSACPGSTYTYAGVDLAVGQTQDFTLTNALGCDSIVTVTVNALPTSASTLTLSACPGSTYTYAGVDLAVGQTQDFTLTNHLGCDSIVTVIVSALPVSFGSLTVGVCPNEAYTFQGQVLPAGTVQDFQLSNVFGCDSILRLTIVEKSASADIVEVRICPGKTYFFQGQELKIGETKDFHFSNSEGCDSLITIVVSAWPSLEFDLQVQHACPDSDNGNISVTVLPGTVQPAHYTLNGGVSQAVPTFSALASGNYTVAVRDENGCVWEESVTLLQRPRLALALENAYLIPCDSSFITLNPILSGDTAGLRVIWWNGAQSLSTSTAEAGIIWVDVSNDCGTNLHRTSTVEWASSDGNPINIYVPNIFSPSAKTPGNALFRPFFGNNLSLLDYRFEVYDRWGSLLFKSEQPADGWEGNFREKTMEPGVFAWQLWVKVVFCGREMELYRKGDVTIEK